MQVPSANGSKTLPAVAYPCSGLHSLPVKLLASRFSHFLYVDYSRPEAEVDDVMARYGLKGYQLVDVASVDPREVIGINWEQYADNAKAELSQITRRISSPFLKRYTFNQLNGYDEQHGKATLQLLFACAESVSFMRLAYNRLGVTPTCLIHVRCGTAFGGNYREYPQDLSQLLRTNPAGLPQYILIDAYGQGESCDDYLDLVTEYSMIEQWLTADRGLLSLMQRKFFLVP